jgi:hypothetical protein
VRRQELSYYWKWLRVRWQRVRGARSPHPAIGRHWRERIDAAQANRAADADEPFALRLGDDAVEIRVRLAPVFSEQARATVLSDDEEPEQFDVTDVVTYAGRVAGDDESEVRLTITGSTLTGYVLTRGDWWFIEPMRRFDREAAQDQYLVYRTKDLAFRHPFRK